MGLLELLMGPPKSWRGSPQNADLFCTIIIPFCIKVFSTY